MKIRGIMTMLFAALLFSCSDNDPVSDRTKSGTAVVVCTVPSAKTTSISDLNATVTADVFFYTSENKLLVKEALTVKDSHITGRVSIPAANGYRVELLCYDVGKNITHSGSAENVNIVAGVDNKIEITLLPSIPSAPTLTGPSVGVLTGTDYTVQWTAVSRAQSYTVEEAETTDFSNAVSKTIIGLSETFNKTVTSTKTYYYRVKANNVSGSGQWSNILTVSVALSVTKTHTLTISVNQSAWGMVSPVVGEHTYTEGTVVVINATPASGYRFVNWTGDVGDASSAQTTVTMNADRTVTANFEIVTTTFVLTLAVNNSAWGATNPSAGSYTYPENTVVTVSAIPETGYRFFGWTGTVANASNATTTVTMSGDIIVTANFEKKQITTNSITMISIPGGTFLMGDEVGDLFSGCRPVHTVTVSSFEMSATQVTNEQYALYLNDALSAGEISVTGSNVLGKGGEYSGKRYLDMGYVYNDNNKCRILYSGGVFTVESGKENWPVVNVTWYGAKAFAEMYGFDLPREAEWEYAGRGGNQYKYGTDDGTISGINANYAKNGPAHPVDVGSYPVNPYGLYDMCGNVWEWCSDWFGNYTSDSATDPTGAESGSERALRGGGWYNTDTECRSASRSYINPDGRDVDIGFRVVRRSQSEQPKKVSLNIGVNITEGGSVTPSPGAHSYNEGDVVTLIATSSSGYRFTGWAGNVADATKASTTVTMTADRTVTANFEKIPVITTGVTMVAIPGGTFRMGDVEDYGKYSNELPVHSVTLSSFEMGAYEITQQQYQMIMGNNPTTAYGISPTRPVNFVTWWNAIKYCNKLSVANGFEQCYDESSGACDFTKNGFRLPTEAEWEYACRAGTETLFYSGNAISNDGYTSSDIENVAWYVENSNAGMHHVGEKTPNSFGLYDMHGNAWEWCNDYYSSYSSDGTLNPVGPAAGTNRVVRGGGFINIAAYCRSAYRYNSVPDTDKGGIGFRVVRRTQSEQPKKVSLNIVVSPSNSGTVTPTVGTHSYAEETVVTITATPSSGYRFTSWTGIVSNASSASTTVTMTADRTVTANFEKIPTTITDITMVPIPGGTFRMGNMEDHQPSDWFEIPVHSVTVSSFEMSIYEVTNAQYSQYLNEVISSGDVTVSGNDVLGKGGPYGGLRYLDMYTSYNVDNKCWIKYKDGVFSVASGKDDWPVVNVTWYGAKAFAQYYGYDLPMEAEWEYASRGGMNYKYGTDDGTISASKANYRDSGQLHPVNVGSYPPNPFGLYDMCGNVFEWCNDWQGLYTSDSVTDPTGYPPYVQNKISRGGCFNSQDSFNRSAYRCGDGPADGNYHFGFRVVRRFQNTQKTQFALTIGAGPLGGGTVTPSSGTYRYDENTIVTIQATPDDGYRFVNWTGFVEEEEKVSTTVTMTVSQTVTAHFEQIKPINTELEMVTISGGSFLMGDVENFVDADENEKPVHNVTVSSFEMSRYEVTNAQYCQYLKDALASGSIYVSQNMVYGKNGTYVNMEYLDMNTSTNYTYSELNQCWISYKNGVFNVEPGKENWPVVKVTWYGAKMYTQRYGYDLPREAEWEYACRGGKQLAYGTDDGTISSNKVNYKDGGPEHPVNVGAYPPNPYGLYDMSGNVMEWCNDLYGNYTSANVIDPTGASTGTQNITRGGTCMHVANLCRSASRIKMGPGSRHKLIGFRVVRRP